MKSKFNFLFLTGLSLSLFFSFASSSEWKFDGTSDDEAGINHGTITGAKFSNNGYLGQGIEFDGDKDYVDFGNDASLSKGTTDFSISFWFKKSWAADVYQSILYKATPRTRAPGYGFLLRETGGQLKFTIADSTPTVIEAVGPGIPNTNWHHAVGVRGGGKVRLYLDNALAAEINDTVGSVDNIEPLTLGMGGYGNNLGGSYIDNDFRGMIDELQIFDKALTAQEIDQMYQQDVANHKNPPAITLNSPVHGELNVSISPSLGATATDSDVDIMDVSFYGGSTNAVKDEFTIIVLPDTQAYVDPGTYAHVFTQQTQWIVDNKDALNIAFVTHVGDIVNNWDNTSEWTYADASMSLLDGVVPYGVLPGNHDQQFKSSFPHNATYYNQYFGYSRFEQYPWYSGHYEDNNDNNYQLITAGGMDFIIIHLEYYPSAGALNWANQLLASHPNRRGIVVSHYIVRYNGYFSTLGDMIFNALKDNPNLFLLLSGHDPNGAGRRSDVVGSHTIHSIMTDYQTQPNGGDGWLKMLTFSPKDNTINIKTYSPFLDRYRGYTDERFNLDYPMTQYILIGTKTGVQNGASVTVTWPNLADNQKYYWYAVAQDSNLHTAKSEVRAFKTYGYAPPPPPPVNNTDPGTTTSSAPPEKTELQCFNNILNPTKGNTVIINAAIKNEAELNLTVYNSKGEEILILTRENKTPNVYSYTWDGKDNAGNTVGSGIYFVHMIAGGHTETKKIAVVK